MNREQFASKMLILAQECAELHNINPAVVAAQACLETGYGKSILSKKANNLFNIKALDDWKGIKYPMKDRNFCTLRGWTVKQVYYRSYATWTDCIKDYSSCIEEIKEHERATERALDPIGFLDGILPRSNVTMGFVTDPRYREKILSIANKWKWL